MRAATKLSIWHMLSEKGWRACSNETSSFLCSLSAVWLGVRAWDSSSSEMFLSLSVLVSSKEQAVATYYNYKLEIERKRKSNYVPEGVCMTSSSRVRQVPPAATILALALSVKRRAATFNFGTSNSLSSSVIVVTATTVLSLYVQNTPVSKQSIGREGDLRFLCAKMFDDFGE